MKKIHWPADVYGSVEDYFPDERDAEKVDPRADIPPAESLEEFDRSPERADETAQEKPVREKGKALVAFPLISFENIALDTDRRGYLVKGLLPSRGLAVIWGPPKCGKSFWATDIGLHIALGWEYRGRRVQQTTVVYLALEGRQGLPARFAAFRQHHGIDAAPFYLLTTPLDLAAKADALIASIEAQLGDTNPAPLSSTRSIEAWSARNQKTRTWRVTWPPPEKSRKNSTAWSRSCTIAASTPPVRAVTRR
jgi:AAA domain